MPDATSRPIPPVTPPIVVLGRDTCADTVRCLGLLRAREIPHLYRNVELDPEADVWIRSFHDGNRVTPTILIGDPAVPARVLTEPSNDDLLAAIAEVAAAG
jgi:glutaredoxin